MLWRGWQIDEYAVPYWINKDFINRLGGPGVNCYISYRPEIIYKE